MNIAMSIFKLLGSLALFLFGMSMMSENLQKVAGDKLRSFLAMMTSNAFKRVLTGLTVTACIQSSAATTLMVVSFVNAGLPRLLWHFAFAAFLLSPRLLCCRQAT